MQYISAEHQRAISERYKVASIIVIAFCVSVGVLAIIARLIEPRDVVPGSERLNSIIPTTVIVLAMGVVVLRRVWMSAMVFGGGAWAGVNDVLDRMKQAA